jgi:fructose-1,6-bisphosphatase/inositol monophosphatase family enzyme
VTSPTARQALIADLFRRYDALALGAFRHIRAETKADGTTVTEVDRAASRLVIAALKAHTPDYGIVSEEEAETWQPRAPWRWVVDPLDGTASFARGYPAWGLGVGLLEADQPREGYLRFPVLDERYEFDGAGLRFNGEPAAELEPETIGDTRNYLLDSSLHNRFASFKPLGDVKLRVFGSNLYHMVCLAMGRAEAMICGRVFLWDLAAALPITRARGFVERYVDGSAFTVGELLASETQRCRLPLVLSTPERVEHIVAVLKPVL